METRTNRHCWLLVLSLGGSCLLGCRDRAVTADKDVQRQEVTPVPHSKQVAVMPDAWDFYFARVNGALASLFVDLGIRRSVPDPQKPWLLWAWVYFRQPREDGLSSAEEAPRLFQIEDALTKSVEGTTQARLVGRITTAGRREFYFYGARTDGFQEAVVNVLKGFPDYRFDLGNKRDPAWSQYLEVLYPTPRAYQQIQNRRVIEALEKQGDPLTAPRPVSHWAYFPSAEKRAEFGSRVVPKGFKITNEQGSDDPEAKYPYGVTLERTDRVDRDSIDDITLDLLALAQELGGEYDGWETTVEKGI
jgi:regulator of RNase E activity RraB